MNMNGGDFSFCKQFTFSSMILVFFIRMRVADISFMQDLYLRASMNWIAQNESIFMPIG